MSQVIASTYRIEEKIGSGGGGNIYLATHLRLQKKVVLKADKRILLKTKPEALRQEVDILKKLNHTYIPQVYDFFVEDDTVYTVIDYIEGESLDKPLKRGERFSQVQVVAWACQLLQALEYLHSRPPYGILHADIKPANIMLTPQNDIRLIDFNIALALGAEGAVMVGHSHGYASPEHYTQISAAAQPTQTSADEKNDEETTYMANPKAAVDETLPPVDGAIESSSDSSSGKKRSLDVRSDIYSLGATLYHLITGIHPPAHVQDLIPIPADMSSLGVREIIMQAMSPNPDDRYQTAADMLNAFKQLHENDIRTKKYKKTVKITAAALGMMFLFGCTSAFVGLKQMEQIQNVHALTVQSEMTLQAGDVSQAISCALQALLGSKTFWNPPYTAQAQKALTNALGIYNVSDGFYPASVISLPSEPLKCVLSPDGKTAAVMCAEKILVFDTQTDALLTELEAEKSALADFLFSSNEILIYAGKNGVCSYNIPRQQTLWSADKATHLALSADGSKLAAIYKDADHAVIYDTTNGQVQAVISYAGKKQAVLVHDSLADPEDNLLAFNQDGSLLAISFADGGLSIFDVQNPEKTIEIYDTSDYRHFEGGFAGHYFAFAATQPDESVFAVLDMEKIEQTGGFRSSVPFHVQINADEILLSSENLVVSIDPVTGEQQEQAYTQSDVQAFRKNGDIVLTATQDKNYQFFGKNGRFLNQYPNDSPCDLVQIAGDTALVASLNQPVLKILHFENHDPDKIFSYDPDYLHDEARLSADGQTVMLYRYDRFRLYNRSGEMLADVQIPQAEQVYDQQYYRKDGISWLEVTYNDGTVEKYSAQDGQKTAEIQKAPPDESLEEEFLTNDYRIVAPLHETPVLYDRKTGEFIKELEPEAYLTYVTQVDENYIITEYITSDGERYGLLLNAEAETIAALPNLCDISGKELIFDNQFGDLYQRPIYSLEELIALAQNNIKKE